MARTRICIICRVVYRTADISALSLSLNSADVYISCPVHTCECHTIIKLTELELIRKLLGLKVGEIFNLISILKSNCVPPYPLSMRRSWSSCMGPALVATAAGRMNWSNGSLGSTETLTVTRAFRTGLLPRET